MDVNNLDLPDDISYIDKLLWVKRDYEDETYYVGITDFAQQILGDIISVYFSDNEQHEEGDEFFTVTSLEDELVVVSPFSCNVLEENAEIKLNPEELNEKIKPSNTQISGLVGADMDADTLRGLLIEAGMEKASLDQLSDKALLESFNEVLTEEQKKQ